MIVYLLLLGVYELLKTWLKYESKCFLWCYIQTLKVTLGIVQVLYLICTIFGGKKKFSWLAWISDCAYSKTYMHCI